jgi:tetratricopeptide (TPR) repeat protein
MQIKLSPCIFLYKLLLLNFFYASSFAQSPQQRYENYLHEGKTKMENKKYTEAIRDFSIAAEFASAELTPQAEPFAFRAIAKQYLEDLRGALLDYNQAIDIDSLNAVFFNNRANLKDELGLHEDAIKDYNKAILLDTNYINAFYNRAIAEYNLEQYEASKKDFEKIVNQNAQDANAWIGLGLAEIKLGNKPQACLAFQKAQQLESKDVEEYITAFCNP